MQIRLPEEYSRLPAWQIRMAILHATSYVEDVLSLTEADPSYSGKLQKEAVKFLKEGITESLTPHMSNPSNPTSPIAKAAFDLQPFFNFDGAFLSRNIPDTTERERWYKMLKTAVNTLQLVYTGAAFKKRKSEYEFKKGARGEQLAPEQVNRYERLFVTTAILSLIEPLFRLNPEGLDKFLRSRLEGHTDLGSREYRAQFVKQVRDAIKEDGISEESLKKIL